MLHDKHVIQTWLVYTATFIVLSLLMSNAANAQITRDVGSIAVIEGDNSAIFMSGRCQSVNTTGVARKFYQTHADEFHTLIIFTTLSGCEQTATPYHEWVLQSTKGIGRPFFDHRVPYGSSRAGALEGVVNMHNIDRYFRPGAGSAFPTLAQEFEHRWAAFVTFDCDPGPQVSSCDSLLGRDEIHWSFFFHTAAVTSTETVQNTSSMEGNFWLINSPTPGKFQTTGFVYGYSRLDLYLMGLLSADEVGPFWFISDPHNVIPPNTRESAPGDNGTVADGTQTFVTIQDIIRVFPEIPTSHPVIISFAKHSSS
ncbi:MAG: hypothetical protein WAQ52_05150 [Terriglobales bacterium]